MSEREREERFRMWCEFENFDLAGFDRWLEKLGECGAKRELEERRQAAMDAVFAEPFNEEAVLRHIEYMYLRRRWICRVEALLPLARRDMRRQAGTKKPRNPQIDEWISGQLGRRSSESIDEMFNRAPDDIRDVVGLAAFKKRVARCRKRLK